MLHNFRRSFHNTAWTALMKVALFLLFSAGLSFPAFAVSATEEKAVLDEAQYREDLQYLASFPHRLPGSEWMDKSADYIEKRLREAGLDQVLRQKIKVPYLNVDRCELEIGGEVVALAPMRPNITIPPATPPEGVTGSLIYVGRGEMQDYDEQFPEDSIVLIDYDSSDNWQKAFSLGAKAVIFLGGSEPASSEPLNVSLPMNLLRFYMERDKIEELGLDQDKNHPEVTLHSDVAWEFREDVNIVARVPGRDPTLDGTVRGPESIVFSAAYDTFGEVPHRTPGARRAANVAALLGMADSFQHNPPARDTIFMFLANRSYNHQGAREIYDALSMEIEQHESLISEHDEEAEVIQRSNELLEEKGLLFDRDAPGGDVLHKILRDKGQAPRDDIAFELQKLRIEHSEQREDKEIKAREERLERTRLNWDALRRALYNRLLKEFIEKREQYSEGIFETAESRMWNEERKAEEQRDAREQLELSADLLSVTEKFLEERLQELAELREADAERSDLRRHLLEAEDTSEAILQDRAIVLHASFDFSDIGYQWAPLPVSNYHQLLNVTAHHNPGYYMRILAAFREAENELDGLNGLSRRGLRDPRYGVTFIPGLIAPEGLVAGRYGIYNVALATGFDRRFRDGHPADNLENLNEHRILKQAREAARLMHKVADRREISVPRILSDAAESKYPGWHRGRATGEMASKHVMGGLDETRPAPGALMALWNGSVDWSSLENAGAISDFMPFSLEPTDARGRFRILGAVGGQMMLGALFNETGQINWITNQGSIHTNLAETGRPNLIHVPEARPVVVNRSVHRSIPGTFRMLNGRTNTPFRPQEALWGGSGSFSFGYISAANAGTTVKFFQPNNLAIFGEFTEEKPLGAGLSFDQLQFPISASSFTYRDLWQINEHRMRLLRTRGVSRVDLETLHNAAMTARIQAEEEDGIAAAYAQKQSSASISQRIYRPLLNALNDLVVAIVLLLLLTIPFAFAMERLAIGATSIYGRINGFVIMFFITFILLYWMHPGFAVSSTPIIIFLAFVILLLSSLVIYILLRKFDSELKALQGQSLSMHNVQVSRTGTMLAAINMGMSTMRRRPTRTILSTITVVILTFTILCFASFTQQLGVRTTYERPIGEEMPVNIHVRNTDYSELPIGVLDLLRQHAGEDGLLAEHWWFTEEEGQRLIVANPHTDNAVEMDAAMGINPDELDRWPAFNDCLEDNSEQDEAKTQNPGSKGVYLPARIIRILDLEAGDDFLLHGQSVTLAGALNTANLQRLRNIDNHPVVPVDFVELDEELMQDDEDDEDDEIIIDEAAVQRSFTRVSPSGIIISSTDLVKDLGGKLHFANLYPGEDMDITFKAEEIARELSMPVWAAGEKGVERMMLTYLFQLAGGFALGVPLLLGGFIIFGTLLGSISDREREIFTFSALGLSPGHVGTLFFAEAAVYAVVGGMGGQLLAQTTALIASALAERDIIEPVSINFSSTNSLFAVGVVMLVVLISAVYPAVYASRSANPGLARTWRLPNPEGDKLDITFPFTVSAYDITGVVSFLAEHFRSHDDAGLGSFAASEVAITRNAEGNLELSANLALAPFDLGVTQHFVLTAVPSDIEGVDQVVLHINRLSGTRNDWFRNNKVFIRDLRRQFLVWRTLDEGAVENYRMETLQTLGEEAPSEDMDI